MYKSICGI